LAIADWRLGLSIADCRLDCRLPIGLPIADWILGLLNRQSNRQSPIANPENRQSPNRQ
jgi:hypothetical protein